MSDVGKWILAHGFQAVNGGACQTCRHLLRDKNDNRYCLEMMLDGINRMEARIEVPQRNLCSKYDGRDNISVEIPF
jgi:hypothetical protein